MITPLVSIIMPTSNRWMYIEDAIKSVLDQTYENWELLILDDSDTDSTSLIIDKFAGEKRIRYIRNGKKLGIAKSRNILLNLARGNFIGHLDDDDILRKDAIESIIFEFLNNIELALVYSDFVMIDEFGNKIGENVGIDFDRSKLAFLGFRHFTIYKRNVAISVGEFNDVYCEDGDLFMRIAKDFQCKRVPEFLYYYRSHRTNFGHSRPKCEICDKKTSCNYFKIWEEESKKFLELNKN